MSTGSVTGVEYGFALMFMAQVAIAQSIATAAMLYGLSSGAALATVVGVLIEVPLMLALVRFCLHTQGWFQNSSASANTRSQT